MRERRLEVARASARLDVERASWRAETGRIRALAVRNRELLTVAGGFMGGLAAGQIRWRAISRIGGLAGAVASFALRTPIVSQLFDGMTKGKVADASPADASSQ